MSEELRISITLVIFSIRENTLCVFLEKNKLPTIQLEKKSHLENSVKKLFESSLHTSIDQHYFEQLYTVSSEKTDDISIVYFVLVENSTDTHWQEIKSTQKTNDAEIISYATQRLRWKIEYTNVVYSLLPEEFTLSELQKTYEAIFDKPLDKRNFRKKILSLGFVQPTGKKKVGIARPAEVYRFKERKPAIVNIFS